MKKNEVLQVLRKHGFQDKHIEHKLGGILVNAEKRIPIYEFDYNEFVFRTLEGKVDESKIHFLDNWTFSIECEEQP